MKTTLIRPLAPLALIAALALSACSGETATFEATSPQGVVTQNSGGDAGGTTGSTESDEAAGGDAAAQTVAEESAAAAGINLAELGAPVATATAPATVDGDPDATMEVAFYGLKQDGQALIATYSFTVISDADQDPVWLYGYLGGQSWRPYLIDTVNLTRHDVLRDKPGAVGAATDSQGTKFRPGQTFYAYAAYAMPPEGVPTMTVDMAVGAPAVVGVEIQ